ncbi:hypothetical protein G9A89_005317 [Geosiphon pyriformis]|nr:hypothetical protein G9A89_005317 [Geosiphon pyriformis]
MPEKQNFHHTALSEGRAAAQQQNSSYIPTTIPPIRIAENANLSDIFLFKFKANESPFLLSNAAANKQKAITAMYTEAEVEEKPICLILNSGFAESIITYQLMQQLKRNIDQPAQTIIVTADGMKKTSNHHSSQSSGHKCSPIPSSHQKQLAPKSHANLNWETQELTIFYQGQHTWVPATYGTFNKCSKKALVFEFKLEEEKPIIETFMAFGSISNWADEIEQQYFSTNDSLETKESVTPRWNIATRNFHQWELVFYPRKNMETIPVTIANPATENNEDTWLKENDYLMNVTGLMLHSEEGGTPFNAAYNSTLNKLYHYPYNAEMIFDLAMALINRATQENVLEVYYQITSHTYPTKEVQAQWLEQINIKLCEEYIMPCNKQWCPECYAFSIPLPSENNENEIEFGEPEATKKIEATPIYLIKNQSALQLKYFNNNGQGIKPEKAHEIDTGYNLRYSGKDTLVLQPNSLTKINLKIALKIPPGAMVQIAS